MKRIHNLRAERVGLMQGQYLPARIIAGPLVVEFVGVSDGSAVKHVCARKPVRWGKLMIELDRKIVLRSDLLPRKREDSCIARTQKRPVGHRIKSIHETHDGHVGRDYPSREIASASCSGGNGRNLGNALRLP